MTPDVVFEAVRAFGPILTFFGIVMYYVWPFVTRQVEDAKTDRKGFEAECRADRLKSQGEFLKALEQQENNFSAAMDKLTDKLAAPHPKRKR